MASCTGSLEHSRYSWSSFDSGCECMCDDAKIVSTDSWIYQVIKRDEDLASLESQLSGESERKQTLLALSGLRVAYAQPRRRSWPQRTDDCLALSGTREGAHVARLL